jgi:hypothetical protein
MNQFFTSAALIGLATGLLASVWGKIKLLLARLWSVVFVTVSVNGALSTAMKSYAWSNFKRSPFGMRRYNSERAWVRPIKRLQQVAYESLGVDPILFWHGWKPLLMSTVPMKDPASGVDNTPSPFEIRLTFLRGTFNTDAFLVLALERYNDFFAAIDDFNSSQQRRFCIRRLVGRGVLGGAARKMAHQSVLHLYPIRQHFPLIMGNFASYNGSALISALNSLKVRVQ